MSSQPIYINRPHYRSFSFENTTSETSLDQINKLARNFIASLDLGCPSAKHVRIVRPKSDNDHDTHNLTEHQRYLLWVRQWKEIYAGISTLIRTLKQRRRSVRPIPPLSEADQQRLIHLCDKSNSSGRSILNQISFRNLPRLTETAQALLNARYNAKLASRELRRRRISELNSTHCPIPPMWDPNHPETNPQHLADGLLLSGVPAC